MKKIVSVSRFALAAALVSSSLIAGCELIAEFDRSKVPVAADGGDASVPTTDAAVTDADASIPDGSVQDASTDLDASDAAATDGAVSDADAGT